MNFTWIPFYEELARKIVSYEKHSKDLAELIVAVLQEQGMSADWLRDKDAKGFRTPLDAIDPFTFYAVFNRHISDENRIGILKALKQRLQVSAAVPSDFDGIPVVNNLNAWFFDYRAVRKPDAIGNLWALFLECLGKPISQVTPEVYQRVAGAVGAWKTTMGLFWVKPNEYLSLDGVMRGFLEDHIEGADLDQAKTRDGYAEVTKAVRDAFPGRQFCDISDEAWMTQRKPKRACWVLALGEGSEFWDDCYSKGIVRVGWDSLKCDLTGLSPQELEAKYKKVFKNTDDLKGIRDFVLVMKPGDRVFIKQGRSKIIAYGEITEKTPETNGKEYLFRPDLDTYRHLRPVKWLKVGNWELQEGMRRLPIKTLTLADQQRE